jgi:hypothetical protein
MGYEMLRTENQMLIFQIQNKVCACVRRKIKISLLDAGMMESRKDPP